MTYQQTIIVGNVGRDAELRYTPQGLAVADFSVAVSKVTGKGESRKEKTTWFKVTVWRDRAEVAAQYIKKGMKIMVIGEIDASAYIGKQDGKAMASLELTANDFHFLDSKRESGGGEYQGARSNGGGDMVEDSGDIPF
ncbi:MAG: single-stranded DNA-binding protein [Chloroflexota bacterium]